MKLHILPKRCPRRGPTDANCGRPTCVYCHPPPPAAKRDKYRAKAVLITGHGQLVEAASVPKPWPDGYVWFASQREALRWQLLRSLEAEGIIVNLRRQVPFDIVINDRKICRYNADFMYRCPTDRRDVIEDTKGVRTAVYKLKKKLMRACLGLTITEI